MTATDTLFAMYVKNSHRGKWKLDSIHPTREEAVNASANVRAAHTWVTPVPRPMPEVDPTMNPLEAITRD